MCLSAFVINAVANGIADPLLAFYRSDGVFLGVVDAVEDLIHACHAKNAQRTVVQAANAETTVAVSQPAEAHRDVPQRFAVDERDFREVKKYVSALVNVRAQMADEFFAVNAIEAFHVGSNDDHFPFWFNGGHNNGSKTVMWEIRLSTKTYVTM